VGRVVDSLHVGAAVVVEVQLHIAHAVGNGVLAVGELLDLHVALADEHVDFGRFALQSFRFDAQLTEELCYLVFEFVGAGPGPLGQPFRDLLWHNHSVFSLAQCMISK
jgi:hypothetical protein